MSLTVAHLSARRGAREVLRDVSFSAQPSQILGVIGPNGAGKTTLFECVAGLLPHDGAVTGAALFYVPDAIRPWPDQTVQWTLDLHSRLECGTSGAAFELQELDLERLAGARAGTLSKGETKRLGLALGLTVPRPVLLLDEPFDGLDLRQTRQVMDVLRRDAANGRTLILSIHQLTDAARVCDRFLLLNAGRAVAEGTLAEIGGNLEEAFLALP